MGYILIGVLAIPLRWWRRRPPYAFQGLRNKGSVLCEAGRILRICVLCLGGERTPRVDARPGLDGGRRSPRSPRTPEVLHDQLFSKIISSNVRSLFSGWDPRGLPEPQMSDLGQMGEKESPKPKDSRGFT